MVSTSAPADQGRTGRGRRSKAAAGNSDVYTMAEAARLKGVSYHTVSRAVRRGKLPAQRLGRMALISADDLRDWRPMRERAPRKYRRREPDLSATPALLDLASGERVSLAQRLSTLYELIHGASGQKPLPEFLALLADRLASALDLRRVSIWVLADDGKTLRRMARFGPEMSGIESARLDQAPLFQAVLEAPEAVSVLPFAETWPEFVGQANDITDLFVAPLRAGGRVLGFVLGDRGGPRFTLSADQIVLAEGLANQAALALDRARLRDEQLKRVEQLAAIIDNVAEAVVAIDADGNMTSINAAGRNLYGIDEAAAAENLEQAVNRVDRREMDGSALPSDQTPLMRALDGERMRDRRYVIIRNDGAELPVSVNAQPIRNADGAVTGAVAVIRQL
ncbi:MAG TPA: GAF domain-containing protein [Thermomicrobiales bacterium]|nr:GAF domain-containing protein [Thermomicrobiales bacterium]